ncbi:MAG: rod shape-determining protein MreD [Bacteroidota bacterium]
MNSTVLVNIFRFIGLLALQVVVFNRLNMFGYLNPYPYILFIMLFPVNGNRAALLVSAFVLGLCVDMFADTSGPHAAASVVLAYLRRPFFKLTFGISFEYQTIKINDRLSPERFSFILICIVAHHLILYLLEAFDLGLLFSTLLTTLYSTIFTFIISIIIIYLIKPAKE